MKNNTKKIKKSTQEDKIFNHLVSHKSITQVEAYKRFAIFGLSKIISRLRQKGFKIKTVKERGINRFGDSVVFSVYVYKGV